MVKNFNIAKMNYAGSIFFVIFAKYSKNAHSDCASVLYYAEDLDLSPATDIFL